MATKKKAAKKTTKFYATIEKMISESAHKDVLAQVRDEEGHYLEDAYSQLATLEGAVRELYTAAHWTADRPVESVRLWANVRDAAGIAPGNSPTPIPAPPSPEALELQRIKSEWKAFVESNRVKREVVGRRWKLNKWYVLGAFLGVLAAYLHHLYVIGG